MAEEEMFWDLSQLVEKSDPIFIQKQLQLMVEEAGEIRESYYGKIENLDAKGLLRFLELRDAYTLKFDGIRLYCGLMYSADSTNQVAILMCTLSFSCILYQLCKEQGTSFVPKLKRL
jgi:oligoendopeptidase F